jgi:hypothetical protein
MPFIASGNNAQNEVKLFAPAVFLVIFSTVQNPIFDRLNLGLVKLA